MFRARCFVSSSLVLARPGRAVLALLELVHIADSVSESVVTLGCGSVFESRGMVEPRIAAVAITRRARMNAMKSKFVLYDITDTVYN